MIFSNQVGIWVMVVMRIEPSVIWPWQGRHHNCTNYLFFNCWFSEWAMRCSNRNISFRFETWYVSGIFLHLLLFLNINLQTVPTTFVSYYKHSSRTCSYSKPTYQNAKVAFGMVENVRGGNSQYNCLQKNRV